MLIRCVNEFSDFDSKEKREDEDQNGPEKK